jgi:peroxin-5
VPAEEDREAKGDFEKVWESLKPQAERLNQLAEWEKDFSQVRRHSGSARRQPLRG